MGRQTAAWGLMVLGLVTGAGLSTAAAQSAADGTAGNGAAAPAAVPGAAANAANIAGGSQSHGWGTPAGGTAVGARFGGPYHQYGYDYGWPGYQPAPHSAHAVAAPYQIRPYYYDSVFPSHYRPNHFGFAWYRPVYPGHEYGYTPGFYTPYGSGFYGGYGYNAFVSGPGYGYGCW